MRVPLEKVAGAPISWGVCEVPGWGHQLPPERVLAEMSGIGLTATEAGPEGFLPTDPPAAQQMLADHGLRLVGGFVPVVLHDDDSARVQATIDRACSWLATTGAEVAVLAAVTAEESSYDARADLDADAWRRLNAHLDLGGEVAATHGLTAVLHPHVGTVVERREDIERVLEGSTAALCLDTGHLLIGGIDPVAFAKDRGRRVQHLQLKDVNGSLAEQVRDGRLPYTEAVRQGIYTPLGDGDVDVAAVIERVQDAGYEGWYVLEQDVVLEQEPPIGSGPVKDVERSMNYLRDVEMQP